MAGIITVTATIQDQVTGGQTDGDGLSQAQFTQAGVNTTHETMATSTSPTQIPIGSIGTLGWLWVKNLDPTNNIMLRMGSGGTNFCTLLPGMANLVYVDGAAPYALSSGGTPVLLYFASEA